MGSQFLSLSAMRERPRVFMAGGSFRCCRQRRGAGFRPGFSKQSFWAAPGDHDQPSCQPYIVRLSKFKIFLVDCYSIIRAGTSIGKSSDDVVEQANDLQSFNG